ncbi:MAG TPA: tRNA (adenosine(37)-N6)-dimethylallyltransferase MiaA [Chthoniobacterales bacterium]|jgi:tRNA dimethylallyltransferase
MGKWDDVFVVAGPTASGKSAFAVDLAERLNAEIISADAYQIYRGLSVLTAQPTAAERVRVRHHLVDVLEPEVEWSAANFARAALDAMEEIRRRGKRICVVGGAGFYLEALFDGLPDTPPPNLPVRERLSLLSVPELVSELQRSDPEAAAVVDLQNPRRLQRALEIVITTGKPFASFARQPDLSVRGIVLNLDRAVLHDRMEKRVASMLTSGALEEVSALGARSKTCGKSIGLGEISQYLAGSISLEQCREQIVIATRQYAKRQMTWFRNRSRWELVAPERAMETALALTEI